MVDPFTDVRKKIKKAEIEEFDLGGGRVLRMEDGLVVYKDDKVETPLRLVALQSAVSGTSANNLLGGLINSIESRVSQTERIQRVEAGTNRQRGFTVETELNALQGQVESQKSWLEFLSATIRALLVKMDTDNTAQNAAVTNSQLDEDYDDVWGT